jgi:endonuclease III
MVLVRSGAIWAASEVERRRYVTGICEALRLTYGDSDLGNPPDSIDDLIYIVLSNKTTPSTANKLFKQLKFEYPRWEDILAAEPRAIEELLRPAGFSRIRSAQIVGLLTQLRSDFGECSLRSLQAWDDCDIHAYLCGLSGVSDKVAKCVMLFTLHREVLPVDAHVFRIATRLGLTARARPAQAHEELEALVPVHLRKAFHVGAILHGRQTCRPSNPKCAECCVQIYCRGA